MKLRNKKTGEIGWLYCDHIGNPKKMTVFLDDNDLSAEHWDYESLAELNADWEDYKPAEPLINDEKVCNLIRAWADFTNNNQLTIRVDKEDDDTFCDYNFLINKHLFMRFFMRRVDGLESGEYTIAELCGEEKQ